MKKERHKVTQLQYEILSPRSPLSALLGASITSCNKGNDTDHTTFPSMILCYFMSEHSILHLAAMSATLIATYTTQER